MRAVLSLPVPLRGLPTIQFDNIGYWFNDGQLAPFTNFSTHYQASATSNDTTKVNLYGLVSYQYLNSNAKETAMVSIGNASGTGYLACDAEL
jgi:hypothetical protein